MMAPSLQRPPRAQNGFGLIEVLVALTILSIGMLGLASMQLNSLHSARESLNTTIATIMVRDMNERAWAQRGETCENLKDPGGLLSEWQGDVEALGEGTQVLLPGATANKSAPFSDNNNEYGRYYTLTVEWGGEDGNAVELVTFLPCEEPYNE
ncbi:MULTISPECIES: type IV pilus modification protein PilV [Chromohalobacter]|uniref:Type IV pilus modification protein PilV n=1 Tax=Chromohalobacter moromii TaxID=2860329 RepID=A0A9X3B882_9GAMM|nr:MULTISPECIES: type IV pilus modification protein PilV [Chromohalobacter]MCK2047270.1 type IV pilus modification protein PilV [Chromohalobacter moromii]MCT8470083.1 type IV pilus modification protein PilV [Chromohalobacter canadensis]MCT8473138.1 type IV pilus modification protein PilV [Chromohalobacter canadensis]MCT8500528.1 type IV pilus modification protein PilV [Chromohalobacter canadensis]MCT8506848.1 type IV pilus modification protein PilV [Chromohalobacter moromii]